MRGRATARYLRVEPLPPPPAFDACRRRSTATAPAARTRGLRSPRRGFALDAARGARRDRARQPRGRGLRLADAQGRRDARGRATRSACAHNFRASTVYTQAQLADPEFTREQRHRRLGDGVQRRQHRAARRDAGRVSSMTTLGPYDYWAIEYGVPADRRRSRRPTSSRGSPRAATSRCSRSRPTRTSIAGARPGREPVRPRRRPARLRRSAGSCSRRSCGSAADAAAEAGRDLRVAAPQLRRAASGRCARAAALDARSTSAASTCVRDHAGTAAPPLTPVPPAKQRAALKLSRPACSRPTASGSSRSSCAAGDRLPRPRRRVRRRAVAAGARLLAADRRCSRCSAACSTS